MCARSSRIKRELNALVDKLMNRLMCVETTHTYLILLPLRTQLETRQVGLTTERGAIRDG